MVIPVCVAVELLPLCLFIRKHFLVRLLTDLRKLREVPYGIELSQLRSDALLLRCFEVSGVGVVSVYLHLSEIFLEHLLHIVFVFPVLQHMDFLLIRHLHLGNRSFLSAVDIEVQRLFSEVLCLLFIKLELVSNVIL